MSVKLSRRERGFSLLTLNIHQTLFHCLLRLDHFQVGLGIIRRHFRLHGIRGFINRLIGVFYNRLRAAGTERYLIDLLGGVGLIGRLSVEVDLVLN